MQLCSKNALGLYPADRFLVLLSSSQERQAILSSLGIPHLQYYPEEDQKNFPDWIQELMPLDEDNLETFWHRRISGDEFMLHRDEPKLYPEDRSDRMGVCVKTAKELLAEMKKEDIPEYVKEVLERSVLWSQLIWSDPGQVLWDSFLLSIKSCLKDSEDNIIKQEEDITELKGKQFAMHHRVVLLRQGRIIYNGETISCKCKLVDNFDNKMQAAYTQIKFGKGRSGGLDIRACGGCLVRPEDGEGDSLSYDEMLNIAGLPWQQICKAVHALGDAFKEDKKAFDALCQGVRG